MRIIKGHLGNQFKDSRSWIALAAALVHDLGHGPFSHAFESVGRRLQLPMANHEVVSDVLIRDGEVKDVLKSLGGGFASDVADVIKSPGPGNLYNAVVSSQFDADRLDYMRRDRLMTGTQLAGIDFEWLIANIEVGSVPANVDDKLLEPLDTFIVGPKAVYAAEAYVLGLFQLYPTVYFHKATRSAEKIFSELLFRVLTLVRDGSVKITGLPDKHPLVRFGLDPNNVDMILALDDTTFWGALWSLDESEDQVISEFSRRLRDRKLLKCIDIRSRMAQRLGDDGTAQKAEQIEKKSAVVKEKLDQWLLDKGGDSPRILIDQGSREPYKRLQESKGPLNQIRVRVAPGDAVDVDLGERSKVVQAIQPFTFLRAYLRDTDDEARNFVEQTINSEA
jgi:uncharacterized protein